MKRRRLHQRVRVTLPGPPVTRTITPAQIERYLTATGRWRRADAGPIQDLADRSVSLARAIATIAQYEGRSPGEVLTDIADGRGTERWLRSRKTWPSWP